MADFKDIAIIGLAAWLLLGKLKDDVEEVIPSIPDISKIFPNVISKLPPSPTDVSIIPGIPSLKDILDDLLAGLRRKTQVDPIAALPSGDGPSWRFAVDGRSPDLMIIDRSTFDPSQYPAPLTSDTYYSPPVSAGSGGDVTAGGGGGVSNVVPTNLGTNVGSGGGANFDTSDWTTWGT